VRLKSDLRLVNTSVCACDLVLSLVGNTVLKTHWLNSKSDSENRGVNDPLGVQQTVHRGRIRLCVRVNSSPIIFTVDDFL
jgi:hypothetical protein